MTYRNWFDLNEVSEVIAAEHPEMLSLFNPPKLNEVTLSRFT